MSAPLQHIARWMVVAGVVVMVTWAATACDTVEPDVSPRMVVEAFFHAEDPAPTIRLWKTGPLDAPYLPDEKGLAIGDAEVMLTLDGEEIPYHASEGHPGRYVPHEPEKRVPALRTFRLTASWNGQKAEARGRIPPPIAIDSVDVTVAEHPIRAIFVDSLFLDPIVFDSLRVEGSATGTPEEGYAYPIEVTMWWTAPEEPTTRDLWVRTRLKPHLPEGAALDDFFLRSEQIQLESDAACNEEAPSSCHGASRVWTGVYGIPVPDADAALPPHRVNVALIRSGEDYAQFASTRKDPERREPVSNVEGGLGIVAGIALDSLGVRIE